MKIYISGSLISVKDREKAHQFYEFLADVCSDEGHEPYLPHQNSDPVFHNHLSNAEVFEKDLTNLSNSDLILASINEPSTGVGAEIGIALEKNIDLIALYNKESNPSRFILGLLLKSKKKILVYENLEECGSLLKLSLKEMSINNDLKLSKKPLVS